MSLSERDKNYMNDVFFGILDDIYKLVDENGNEFSYAFHALPLRANLEYYKVIKVPMSYSKIKMASKHHKYTSSQAFINDLAQITWNARFFNEETSDFYKFATILDNYIKDTVIPKIKNDHKIVNTYSLTYPNLGPLPNEMSTINPNDITTINPNNISMGNNTNNNINTQSIPINTNTNMNTNVNNATTATNSQQHIDDDDNYENENDQETYDNEDKFTINQNYNPSTYVSKIEDTGKDHVFYPPPNVLNFTPNRQVLDQWVKRGRPPIVDKPHEMRIKSIMRGLKKIKVGGKTMVSFWDKLPGQQEHPDYLKIVKDPISMLDIKGLIKQRYYKTVDAYVADVFKLINNNRLYFVNNEFIKNNLNVLETNISRLYQIEMSKPDVEYISGQQTNKFPLSQVQFNGRTYKVGNWILINNPNDPQRPTVAQIFRLWQQENGELCMNVCWYYRPEWTVHRVDRLFLENEVVKTGQYRDHLVNEILGPCYVAYFTRWLKGDPGIPFEGPLFICEFRYNDKENTFAKIRTWKACLPDEVRHLEDPIKTLSSNRVLRKFPSPIKGLLRPGSTSSTPIPSPIIINMNSPPVVGAVYVPRVDDEIDEHYFDNSLNQNECKSYVPPTNNIRIPSSALIENYNLNNQSDSYSHNTNTPEYEQVQKLSLLNDSNDNKFKSYNVNNAIINNNSIINTHNIVNQTHHYNNNNNISSINNLSTHKIIKSPYNNTSFTYSKFQSPSTSFTYVREYNDLFNIRETSIHPLIRRSYKNIDRSNISRIYGSIKKKQNDIGIYDPKELREKFRKIDKNGILWFRGPPLNIQNRVLNDDSNVRLGHSVEYLTWKIKQQKEIKEQKSK